MQPKLSKSTHGRCPFISSTHFSVHQSGRSNIWICRMVWLVRNLVHAEKRIFINDSPQRPNATLAAEKEKKVPAHAIEANQTHRQIQASTTIFHGTKLVALCAYATVRPTQATSIETSLSHEFSETSRIAAVTIEFSNNLNNMSTSYMVFLCCRFDNVYSQR